MLSLLLQFWLQQRCEESPLHTPLLFRSGHIPGSSSCSFTAPASAGLRFLACGSPEQTFPVINCPAGFRSDQTTGSELGQEEKQRDMDGMSHECGDSLVLEGFSR